MTLQNITSALYLIQNDTSVWNLPQKNTSKHTINSLVSTEITLLTVILYFKPYV